MGRPAALSHAPMLLLLRSSAERGRSAAFKHAIPHGFPASPHREDLQDAKGNANDAARAKGVQDVPTNGVFAK